MRPALPLSACLALLCPALASAQLAVYDAGSAGNPAVAPDPTAVGWTLVYPAGTGVTLTDVSPDGATGLNAWQVDDQGTVLGERAHYERLFTPQQISDAATDGWEFEVRMRVLASTDWDVLFEYASGQGAADDRYSIFYTVSGGDVIANLWLTGGSYVCPNAMDGQYHTFAYRKAPGALDAELHYDGALVGVLPRAGSNGGAPAGGVSFGTGSSGATGAANFNRVEFRLLVDSGTPVCFGDGAATPCPCGNTAGAGTGCGNSTGAGGLLSASGAPALGGDTLVLTATGVLPSQPGLFFQGDNFIAGGTGVVFGDGLRCCGTNVVRLSTINPDASGCAASDASCGTPLGGMPGSISGHAATALSPGDTKCYQYWYRDPSPSAPCGTGFNLTNAMEVTWTP